MSVQKHIKKNKHHKKKSGDQCARQQGEKRGGVRMLKGARGEYHSAVRLKYTDEKKDRETNKKKSEA